MGRAFEREKMLLALNPPIHYLLDSSAMPEDAFGPVNEFAAKPEEVRL
jgi:hypothetical protein